MQVILKKEVQNIGEAGDLVNVKDGYARNYLIPKNYAEIATEGALKNREQNIARLRAKQEKLHQEALAKAEQIEKIGSIELSAKAGESGKLFGTITTKKLCEELKERANIEIDRKSWYYDLCDSLYILFAAAYNATCKNKMMQNAYKNAERSRYERQKEN